MSTRKNGVVKATVITAEDIKAAQTKFYKINTNKLIIKCFEYEES